MHLVDSSSMSVKTASVKSGRSHKTEGTVKHQNGGGKAKSFVSTIPAHSIKFDEFHNQVRRRLYYQLPRTALIINYPMNSLESELSSVRSDPFKMFE
jgi:hypothetical protein